MGSHLVKVGFPLVRSQESVRGYSSTRQYILFQTFQNGFRTIWLFLLVSVISFRSAEWWFLWFSHYNIHLVASLVAQMVKRLSTMWKTRVWSLGWEVPWRRKWQSIPVLLPGKSHGQRSLVGYSPWGLKESDTTERSSSPILWKKSLPV